MSHILEDLKQFLDRSPTSWHAAAQIGNRLASVDFIPLEEGEKWKLTPGKRYFVIRGGSVCAFAVPQKTVTQAVILGSHTDSPALQLKPVPELHEENMMLLNTQLYGAPLLHSWFNRDLAIAGRVVVKSKKGQVEDHLVFLDELPVIIPALALHLDREQNEKGFMIDKQDHLRPLVGLDPIDKQFLHQALRHHFPFQSLLSFDLFLVPLEESRFLGMNGELIASYRLDNLASAHACVTAIAAVKHPPAHTLRMSLFWDHEEIGSRTAEGAASPFLSDLFERIRLGLDVESEQWLRLKTNSLCVSVDVAHGFNPNFPKKYDPSHKPLLGRGIVLKYNPDRKYASDAITASQVIEKCHKLKLNFQSFTVRSDSPSGSTIGPIVAQSLGIPTVDIGHPLLSMHSAREVIAGKDHLDMCQLLTGMLED